MKLNSLHNELLNADDLDESITGKYFGADGDTVGEDGDEESNEYESEDSEVGGVDSSDLPRFRDLVKAKKLELKAQYGKGYFDNQSSTSRECKNVQVPEPYTDRECKNVQVPEGYTDRECKTVLGKEFCINVPKIRMVDKEVCVNVPKVRMIDKEVCVNVPHLKIVWISGWRKKWREFKRDGGLAQLKMQSKGMIQINPSVLPMNNPVVGIQNTIPTPTSIRFNSKPTRTILAVRGEMLKENSVNIKSTDNYSQEYSTDDESEDGTVKKGNIKTKTSTKKISSDDRFLGMPKNIGIGVTAVIGCSLVAFTMWKLFKK